jgi:hypothetical protein
MFGIESVFVRQKMALFFVINVCHYSCHCIFDNGFLASFLDIVVLQFLTNSQRVPTVKLLIVCVRF